MERSPANRRRRLLYKYVGIYRVLARTLITKGVQEWLVYLKTPLAQDRDWSVHIDLCTGIKPFYGCS